MTTTTLLCNAEGCEWTTVSVRSDDEAREIVCRAYGWRHVDGRDFCPKHRPTEDPSACPSTIDPRASPSARMPMTDPENPAPGAPIRTVEKSATPQRDGSPFPLGFAMSWLGTDPKNEQHIECYAGSSSVDHEIVGLWFDAEPGYFLLSRILVGGVEMVLPFEFPVSAASFGAAPRSDGIPRYVSLGCRIRVPPGTPVTLVLKLQASFSCPPDLVGHVVVRRVEEVDAVLSRESELARALGLGEGETYAWDELVEDVRRLVDHHAVLDWSTGGRLRPARAARIGLVSPAPGGDTVEFEGEDSLAEPLADALESAPTKEPTP